MKKKLPPIGLRIIKSAIAVGLCFFISFLRGQSGIVFYSQLAALWCIQMYRSNTMKNAIQRFLGTTVGALYGLVFLLARPYLDGNMEGQDWISAIVVSLMIVVVLYATVLLRKKQASYFSCVVFLSIVVNHVTDSNPYLFVWNRFLDTVIGIAVGILVNDIRFPFPKRKDILFVSGLDDTLLGANNTLSDYSKVELNRMIDDGVKFTVSTVRTPASLMEPMRDIRLKLPVIAMDGAVLYDMKENRYLKVYVISASTAGAVMGLIRQHQMKCFVNVIVEDTLLIYYEEGMDEVQSGVVEQLRKSPYRNYICKHFEGEQDVVYFMLLDRTERIENFYEKLCSHTFNRELKVQKYLSKEYPGYSYIKIYNANAAKEHMMKYLTAMLKVEQVVTFGTIPDRYDVVVEGNDINQVVRTLHSMYEPLPWGKYSMRHSVKEREHECSIKK